MRQTFELRPSRALAAILAVAHGIALAALIPLTLPAWAKLALGLLTLFSLLHHLRHDAWLATASSGRSLTLEDEEAVLTKLGGETLAGRVSRDSVVTPCFAVLNLVPHGTRLACRVIILPDSLDAESFRQLRVRLRWGR